MFDAIIRFSIRNKISVLAGVLALVVAGLYSLSQLPLDAVPDITNNQVQVVTQSPGLSPEEMEQFITAPVELEMQNLQHVTEIRSFSRFGISVITVVFEDDFDTYRARQLVQEALNRAVENIPPVFGVPEMLPITTGLGEVYQYVLEVAPTHKTRYSLMELRAIQDWIVKRQLAGIPGVVEVSTFGGQLKRWEVAANPGLLQNHGLTLEDLHQALEQNNESTGAHYLERDDKALYIRGSGLLQRKEDLEQIVITTRNGNPVLVRDVAVVQWGATPRYGALTKDGKGEVVGGITLMLKGANSYAVTERVKERMAEIEKALPEGISINPYLDRSELIGRAIGTVEKNLLEGGVIVILVLVLLLGNLRAGLIVASAIPLAMLFALLCMHLFGVSANLMSLGAIDFGLIVDGAVIVTEGILYRLHAGYVGRQLTRSQMNDAVEDAAKQVRQSAAFGEVIILIVYLPILALSGIEGKMFKPMALTVSFAIIGGLILSMTYVPMMASLLLKRKIKEEHTWADRLVTRIQRLYMPVLKSALRRKAWVIGTALVLFVFSLFLFGQLGANFIPKLEEGDFAVETRLPPGTTIDKMVQITTNLEQQLLAKFPEVKQVVSKIGSSEVPTDPMPTNAADVMVILHPKDTWRHTHIQEELATEMKEALSIPGVEIEFQQPIAMRFNELMTGAKSDIAVIIYGDNIKDLSRLGNEAAKYIEGIPGAADIKVEEVDGLPQVRIRYRRDRLAAYGLTIGQVNLLVRAAFAGEKAGVFYEGERRFDMVVRLQADYRASMNDLERLPILLPGGDYISLMDVADVQVENGPALITRENTRRRIVVGVNVRDRDMESVVQDIQVRLNEKLRLPAGYSIDYGGEFENLQAASARLSIAVPVALALIFVLLYFTLHSVRHALLIFTAIPLSAIGGVLALWLRGMPFSISAGIGFIALFGVSVLNGIVLISYLNRLRAEGHTHTHGLLMRGTLQRLRPVLMTASVAALGFLPMAISTEAGAEVQKPLATVVIGGLISSTLLTLVLLPVLYSLGPLRLGRRAGAAGVVVLLGLGLVPLQAQQVLTEQQALDLARQQNLSLQATQARLQAAERAQTSQPLMAPLQLNYTYGQLNTSAKDHNLQALQPLPAWGYYRARRQELFAQYGIALAQAGLAQRQLHMEVRSAYQGCVYQRSRVALLRQTQAHYAELLALDRLRVRTGEASPVDSLATHTRWLAMGWELEQAGQLLQNERLALQLLLQDSLLPLPIDTLLLLPPLPDNGQMATASHPLLLEQEARASVARQQIRQVQAQNRPQLAVGYFYQTLDYVPNYQGVQVAVSLPHSLRANSSRVAAAQQQYRAESLTLSQQQQALDTRRSQLLNDLMRLGQGVAYYREDALPQAETLRKNALLALKAGDIGHAEYLLHLNNLADQQLRYLDTQWQYLQTYLQLEFLY